MVLWSLGYPTQALQRSRDALTLARQLSHSFSLTQALYWAALFHQQRREVDAVLQQAEASIARARAQEFAQNLAVATVFRGWALAMQGQSDKGMAERQQGISAWQATGAAIGLTYDLMMLAEAYGKGGRTAEGLHVLAEALTLANTNGERWREAELHRRKGVLLLALPTDRQAEAEACFQQALAVARQQQAKSWELRVAMSLGRLWQQQGKRTEAHELLAPVYGWFTEGFDTADLQEAKALLDALA